MKIVLFGLTVTSSWGNGHATTYRSLLRALAARGHRIDFIEKDVEWYRSNGDLPQPDFCTVHRYESWPVDAPRLLEIARNADVVVIGSYFPDAIAAAEALFAQDSAPVLFYDIDTPITLAALQAEGPEGKAAGRTEYLDASLIPHFAAYLSFTGGPALTLLEDTFGARRAIAFFCSVDPALYRRTPVQPRFACDLSYLGTYAADRQPKLMQWLNAPAALLPERRFQVAGPLYPADTGWAPNVVHTPHVSPPDHPAFYSSSRFTLNLTRADMIAAGYSPSVRLFEASACGTAILSDDWPGLDTFLTPGEEILIVESAEQVAGLLRDLPEADRVRLGEHARDRILAEHTSAERALQFERIVSAL